MNIVTWWLYYGSLIVASVRAPADAHADVVRGRALASHERVPLCFGENITPSERATQILFATVRR